MSEQTFDVIVMGAGPAGEVAAGRLADGGLRVAIVEPHLIGGECSFYACMPSKALLRPAEVLAEVRRVPGAAEAVSGNVDVAATLARRDEVIHDLDDSSMEPWLEEKGIELFRGEGRLDGEKTVRVAQSGTAGDEILRAERAVILATGSRAQVPPIDGLADSGPWDNREATTAKELPGRLAIIGGGVVGVEMAQAYSSLGVGVTLCERADRVLAREERFAAEEVAAALHEAGVDVRTEVAVTSVGRAAPGGEVTVELDRGGPVVADEVLVAVGREPCTSDIGLDSVGIEPSGYLDVDNRLLVSAAEGDWLYAIGDVNGRALLTHVGKYQAKVAADNILGKEAVARDVKAPPPRVIFTDPQVAAVGHTSESAAQAGIRVRVVDVSTSGNAGGSFVGKDARGTCRLVVDEERRVIAGATFTGADVAETIHAATIAITGELTIDELAHAVPSFPTRSEVWLKLMEKLGL